MLRQSFLFMAQAHLLGAGVAQLVEQKTLNLLKNPMKITNSKNSTLQNGEQSVDNEVIPSMRLYSRNGKLYMETSFNDERIRKSLDTSCPEEAERKAQQYMLDSINERIERVIPVISDLFHIYEHNRLPVGRQANDDTKRKNVVKMRRILVEYGIDPEAHDIRYFARKYRGQPIPEHFAQFHDSSAVRMAKSLFSKGWIKFYKERFGVDTSFFANWISVSLKPAKVSKFYCDERERALIEEKCGALKKTDIALYKAYILAYGLGLRSSEVMRAKWDDLWQTESNKIIRILQPKGCTDGEIDGVGFQDRPCDPAWWDELMSLKSPDDVLIVPVIRNRITRKFPNFLRDECGMTCTQPFHRLRKYAGHRTMRLNNNNPFIAQQVLGHSSVEMTTKIYVGLPTVNTGKIPD